jgi:hypothetical protein
LDASRASMVSARPHTMKIENKCKYYILSLGEGAGRINLSIIKGTVSPVYNWQKVV